MTMHKPLPPPTLSNLYPPLRGYRYFDSTRPLRFDAAAATQAAHCWWLAEHALLAYDAPATIAATLHDYGYAAQCVAADGSFAYAAVREGHGVLAFRGTQALVPGDPLRKLVDVARDWRTDAQARLVPHPGGGRAHGGFAAAVDALWPALHAAVDPACRWWIAGHSLGGALAALAALRLADMGVAVAGIVTCGQPRAGDAALAQRLARMPLLRIVNACDAVPRVPPEAFGYVHGGALLHLDAARHTGYAGTVLRHLRGLPAQLQHGIGALTPIELIDHAPLHYAIKCHNAAVDAAIDEAIDDAGR